MAITTLDGVIAGVRAPNYFAKAVTPTMVAGRPQSLWGLGGNPGAGSFDTTLAGVALSGKILISGALTASLAVSAGITPQFSASALTLSAD